MYLRLRKNKKMLYEWVRKQKKFMNGCDVTKASDIDKERFNLPQEIGLGKKDKKKKIPEITLTQENEGLVTLLDTVLSTTPLPLFVNESIKQEDELVADKIKIEIQNIFLSANFIL